MFLLALVVLFAPGLLYMGISRIVRIVQRKLRIRARYQAIRDEASAMRARGRMVRVR